MESVSIEKSLVNAAIDQRDRILRPQSVENVYNHRENLHFVTPCVFVNRRKRRTEFFANLAISTVQFMVRSYPRETQQPALHLTINERELSNGKVYFKAITRTVRIE